MPDNASPREALSKNTNKYGYNVYSNHSICKADYTNEDENRPNGSVKSVCTVCEADIVMQGCLSELICRWDLVT